MLLAQVSDEVRELTSKNNQGNPVPDESLVHEGSYWFPRQASSYASDVDFLYMAIFWISTVFFAIIVGVMVYFMIKYRRKGDKIETEPSPSHNTAIEILWSVLPSILLVWIFYVGAVGYFEMRIEPENAEEIHVTARKWNWAFTYPDGDISGELHLVRDRPVKLVMRSDDVLHSMYIPAFRQKMDVVPGRYTYAYLMPTLEGKFRLACTEYCGDEHSKMRTLCQVHVSDEDRKNNTQWITADHKPWENGERLYKINCSGCHKVDGTPATGPALNTIWGEQEKIIGKPDRLVDENYVRESILYPDRDVVEGYGPVSKMNSFQGKLSDKDIDYIIAYMKYLRTGEIVEDVSSEAAEAGATPAEAPAETPEETPAESDGNQ